MATNAGATGLNLQAADTVVNVDLPWNPAVLEQRIARAHRMGQKRPVHVYILVTEGTIEEGMLSTLSAKQTLALAALDPDSTVKEVSLTGSIDELKRRLEVLIGENPRRQSMRQGRPRFARRGKRAGRRSRAREERCWAPRSDSSGSCSAPTARPPRRRLSWSASVSFSANAWSVIPEAGCA